MSGNIIGFSDLGSVRLASVYLPAEQTPAAKVDAALERLQLHLTYGPYAGWKDTIRQDVETMLEAWREYQREVPA